MKYYTRTWDLFTSPPGDAMALVVARLRQAYSSAMKLSEALVTVAVFDTIFEASLARGALEALGIPASVPEEVFGPFSGVGGSGRTALQVFESDRDRASVELRRMQIRILDVTAAGAERPRVP